MTLPTRLLISLVIAAVAATLTSVMLTGNAFSPLLLIAFAITAIASALLGGGLARSPDSATAVANAGGAAPVDGEREHGQVKWFNVSKGFGFIVKDDGDEIFVHFRSIRGRERRGLRDGQRVSFVVADSEKGPQAEDVVAESDA
jgi:CspA family cold shock protein